MADYNEVISPLPYFGNIEFYALLLQQDVLIDVHEHFEKQTFRNRCEIGSSQGVASLTVPVKRPSGIKTPCKDILISYDSNWRHDHQYAVMSAYGSSPFFIYYWDKLVDFWNQKYDSLIELNLAAHELIASLLKIENPIRMSDAYIESTPGIDLRRRFKKNTYSNQRYIQVFEEKNGFLKNLSVIDLLFCLGPEANSYLASQSL